MKLPLLLSITVCLFAIGYVGTGEAVTRCEATGQGVTACRLQWAGR